MLDCSEYANPHRHVERDAVESTAPRPATLRRCSDSLWPAGDDQPLLHGLRDECVVAPNDLEARRPELRLDERRRDGVVACL